MSWPATEYAPDFVPQYRVYPRRMDEREFKQVLDGVTGELGRRQRALSQPQLRLHQTIVRHFAGTAQAP